MLQLSFFEVFGDLVGPAPVPPAKVKREREKAVPASEMAPCMKCGRFVLVRPGLCYGCSRAAGLDPNSEPELPAPTLPGAKDAAREARIARYAARAAAGLPLFDGAAPVPAPPAVQSGAA